MMTRAEILALTQTIARDQASDDAIAVYYDEILESLAKSPRPPLVNANLISLTADTATYSFPTEAMSILHAFFENNRLLGFERAHADAYDDTWRGASSADPDAWTQDDETAREVRLYPPPATSTTGGMWIDPFGDDYPDDILALIYGVNRTTDIYDWLAYHIVFAILAREFRRPSDHQDVAFSKLCEEISSLFLALTGDYDAS